MSPSDPAERRAPEASALRIPNQQERPAHAPPAPEPAQGRVVVRELRIDRPVPRRVAAERHPAERHPAERRLADAQPPRPEVRRPDAPRATDVAVPRVVPAGDMAEPEREVVRRVHDDHTGGEWRVFERDARFVPGSRGPRCLYFDGEGIVRRVWQYPADWTELPPATLLALMDRPPLGDR